MFLFHFHRYRNFVYIRTIDTVNEWGQEGSKRIYEGTCEVCGMGKVRKRKE